MTVGDKRYRVTLDGGNRFYLAGIWEAAMADWPLCHRVVTVAANPEVARYQERHGAIIQRRQVMQWLDAQVPESDLLQTPAVLRKLPGAHDGRRSRRWRSRLRL